MPFSGNPAFNDGSGSVNKAVVKSEFTNPVIHDIEELQEHFQTTNLSEITAADLEDTDRIVVKTGSGLHWSALVELSRAMGTTRPIMTKEDIGLIGDGVTDDAPALQRACDFWSVNGGAVFMLRAQPGLTFFLKGTIRSGSNISIIFVSPHTVTKTSRITIAGYFTTVNSITNLTLSAEASAGNTFILLDTSAVGGGPVSDSFTTGDMISIIGMRDSCGTPLQLQEVRVTSVDDGTARLNLAQALNANYLMAYPTADYELAQDGTNVTQVSKLVAVATTADIAAGTNLVMIASGDIGLIQTGDYVLLISEDTCADIGGSNTGPTHVENAQIIGSVSGDPAASLRLSRRTERTFTTAKFTRLIKLEPIQNSIIQSATVRFTQAPDADVFAHPYEIRYAVDSSMVDCSVPNADQFGTRGNSHRLYRSLACGFENPFLRGPKFVDDGEGNGAVFAWSTDCWVRGGLVAGARHALQGLGATNCTYSDLVVENPRHSPLDCHGANEQGVRFVNITASAATDYEADPGNAPTVATFGNPILQAGAHRCGIEGGRFVGFKASDNNHEPCIKIFPPSTNCYVKGSELHNIGTLLGHEDIPDSGTLVANGFRIEDVSVDGWSGWLVQINSREHGATVNTLVDVSLADLTLRHGSRMIDIQYVDEFQLWESEFDEITVDPTETYMLKADACPNLYVERNSFVGPARGFRLTNCLDHRVAVNTFANLSGGTIFFDNGGNTGVWQRNEVIGGVTPAMNRAGGSVVTEGPRAVGIYEMPDDSFIAFIAERRCGVARVWSHLTNTFFGQFSYRGDGTLSCTRDTTLSTAAFAVVAAGGALTGTTGTDGNFTASVTSISGVGAKIWFENRTGGAVTVDFSVS